MSSFVLGVAGATGAGKSTLAFGLQDTWPEGVTVLHIDDYFKPRNEIPVFGGMSNWDDPEALYADKMIADLAKLKTGESVVINTKSPRLNPDYVKTEQRIPVKIDPNPLIVVEGYLALHFEGLRDQYDASVFLDAPFETRLARRVHFMYDEYKQKVLPPMYKKYIAPSIQYADVVLDVGKMSKEAVLSRVSSLILSEVTTD